MGSSVSKQDTLSRLKRILPREPAKEKFDIPEEEPGYPVISRPRCSVKEFYNANRNRDIYKHVKKADKQLESSWDDLIQYLTSPYDTDVLKVRAIFTWLGIQDLDADLFLFVPTPDFVDEITPRGYKKLLWQRKASYASMFALMCRKATIPCVIIKGISKGHCYEVGQTDVSSLRDCWNAVYLDGWRLVHPLWAYGCRFSHGRGKRVKPEPPADKETESTDNKKEYDNDVIKRPELFNDKEVVRADENYVDGKSDKKRSQIFNEYYFLVEPSEFIHTCLPDNSKWQLLIPPIALSQWTMAPHFMMNFFVEGFRVPKNYACELKAKRSECGFVIKEPKHADYGVQLVYDFFFNHNSFDGKFPDKTNLKQYILMARDSSKQKWSFEIRMPVAGQYKLTLYGGLGTTKTLQCLCDVSARCEKPSKTVRPYPACPKIGFGPLYMTNNAGLTQPSHSAGMLFLKTQQTVHITFKLRRSLKAKAKLIGEDGERVKSDKWLSCTVNKVSNGELLDVMVCLLEEGEYALQVYARLQDKNKKKWKNVCNYFLSTKRRRPNGVIVEDTGYKTERELDANKAIEEAMKGTDLHEIKGAIQRANSTEGSFGKASMKFEYLELVKVLKEAISLQNFETLTKAIKRVEISEYADKMSKLLAEAGKEKDRALQTSLEEIVARSEASAIAENVVKATLLVLGEPPENVQTWTDITAKCVEYGLESVLARLQNFDCVESPEVAILQARNAIRQYSIENVKAESYALAALYTMVMKISETQFLENRLESRMSSAL